MLSVAAVDLDFVAILQHGSAHRFDLNRNRRLFDAVSNLQPKLKLLIFLRVGEECIWRRKMLLAVRKFRKKYLLKPFRAPWHFDSMVYFILLKMRGLIMYISCFDKCEPIVQIIMLRIECGVPVLVFVFVYQRISIPLVLSSKMGSNANERFSLNSERFIKSSNLNEHNEMH